MTINSSIGNVIIEDNTFDYGFFTPDGTSQTSFTLYSYTNCLTTNSDAKIQGNTFSGITSSGFGSHLVVNVSNSVSGSQTITNNNFIRGSIPIAAYVDMSTAINDAIITQNIFDQSTVDGSIETLVKTPTLTTSSLIPNISYYANKNQISYLPIQKFPYLIENSTAPTPNPANYARYSTSNSGNSYSDSIGSFTGSLSVYGNEGIAVKYNLPWNEAAGIKLSASFSVVNGSPTITVDTAGQSPLSWPVDQSGHLTNGIGGGAFIVFANDSNYYQIQSVSTTSTSVTNLTFVNTITLTSNYTGISNQSVNATIYLNWSDTLGNLSYPSLSSPLLVSITKSGQTLTAATSLIGTIVPGSLISFYPVSGSASEPFTVNTIDASGRIITVTTTMTFPDGVYSASCNTVSSFFNFSIDVAELLPPNVQILNFILGVCGNAIPSSAFASATYNVWTTASGPANFNPSLPSNSMADVKNFSSMNQSGTVISKSLQVNNPSAVGSGISLATFNGASQYLSINVLTDGSTTGTPNYYVNNGQIIRFNYNIVLNMLAPCPATFIPESPLIIRYRY